MRFLAVVPLFIGSACPVFILFLINLAKKQNNG